ncbi:hypothetical protein [Acidomonas methanolica]|uniref:hypothetical protein n=1 Tax=Acidomonas methanolica TaxID=437 RepID=UPI00211A638E|nr:hypothetical protein [Acidomonas methanolica]MCQ9156210.1 hypothetical protein [Acidomonas methanolica]
MGEVEARLVVFPGKAILSPVEAAGLLGISCGLLRALAWTRCGPRPISVGGRRLYTREELNGFRTQLLSEFGIEAGKRLYRLRLPVEDESARESDPLMRLLCHHRLRHHCVVRALWGMLLFGMGLLLLLLLFGAH